VKHAVAALIVAVTLVTAGCGSKSSGSNLGTALSYVPKNAAAVVAIDTDPDGGQWQQVDHLLGKFPFADQLKQQFKSAFNARANVDYDKDVKPLLGSDLVIAVIGPNRPDTQIPYVLAWKLNDAAAARRLIQATSVKAGIIDGLDVYLRAPTDFAVIKDGTLLIADSMPAVEAALKRPGGAHMTASDFKAALGDLSQDSLVRVVGDPQRVLAWSTTPAERNVQWLSAMSNFAVTLRAESDGIEYAFRTETDSGGLKTSELPLASGRTSPPVVKRPGEVAFAVRNPAQFLNFGLQATRITDPKGYAKYLRDTATISSELGADFERDLIAQLTGNATASVDVGGAFAVRADLRDPAAARTTLQKFERAARNGRTTVPVSPPPNGNGFYTVTLSNGKKYAFNVVGKSFVLATDEARAAQFAAQSPARVSGAKGSLVVYSDARALANAIAAKRGQGVAAQIVTSALGDLTGSVQTETSGITGQLKLQIK
jgi:Protein of unknown function (DUF3352)